MSEPSPTRRGCAGLAVGGSLLASGLVFLVLAVASSWGSASTGWQFFHWVGGLTLAATGLGISTVFLVRLLSDWVTRRETQERSAR